MNTAVIYKNFTGQWSVVLAGGKCLWAGNAAEKAGDVAKRVAADFPNTQVGIRSRDIGAACVTAFGPIVWLNPDFTGK